MKHWGKVKLGQLLKESRIESNDPDTSRRIRVKLNVGGIEKRPDTNDKEGATKYFTRKKGQFIYGRQNLHKGAFGIIPDELDGFESSADIPAFDVDDTCYPEWIFYFFKQGNFFLNLEALAKGVGSKRIHPEQLFELDIPLPSKEEQREILDKVKDFEENYRIVNDEISTQLSLLTALRQAILTEAVQGRLTAQWRRDNPDQEPAAELLRRIAAEKARLIREKKISKEKPLPPIRKEEMPYALPEGWVWCRLGEVLVRFLGGFAYESSRFITNSRNQVLRLGNVKNDQIRFDANPVFIDDEYAKTTSQYELKEDDILITMTGTKEKQDYCFTTKIRQQDILSVKLFLNQRVGCLRFSNEISSNFVNCILKNTQILEPIFKRATGSANQANIGKDAILDCLIPVTCLSEQHAIVRKVNTLLAYCDELEQQVRQSKADVERLMQAVLGEVFGAGQSGSVPV